MSCEQETAEVLRAAGLRCTTPRLLVATALRHAGGHRTPNEVHALVAVADRAMALSTVYRALDALKDARLVSEVDEGTHSAFEWVDQEQPHHHLVCRVCGREVALALAVVDAFVGQIRRSTRFEPQVDHFSISGVCAECRAEGRR